MGSDSSHRGTSEQFATAFAVLARTLNLPTRVVVGFKPGLPADGVHGERPTWTPGSSAPGTTPST
uniref:transglutaminase-like domain-containing protein n=1 Tax=Kitasatospora kifunensis TaxID=58351 RepID=UPI001FE2D626|nr:transglutaminase-like domain-containing protein [Kitasatospora kifunensis]